MKKSLLFILVLFIFTTSFSQVNINQFFANHPELIIKFQMQDRNELESLTRIMSIDNVKGNEVTAYITEKEFAHFLTLNIPYEIVKHPVLTSEELNMLDFEAIKNSRNDWNYYPSYDAYLSMMEEFTTNYPELCRIVEIGTSNQDRKLWACVISKNVHEREAEPQVLWSSSMHGDELTGYVLMLRYIDYLLNNYGTDARITSLLDNTEIWVNPLANPDGAFWASGARRGNANNRDLNRNYKDWVAGNNPDGYSWQKETLAFMDLQAAQTFVLGANIHGGEEVCNYPWDNTIARHADDAWWQLVCREYADTAQLYSSGTNYMRFVDPYAGNYPGVINGYDWYSITGSRQDYANYFDHNREFCLEISKVKTPSASQLPNFWNYNYRSFLNFTEQAMYGIQGIVTDACSGEPVYAKISVPHDNNNSFVMTDPRVGFYARPIKGGSYSVTFSAEGYVSQTVSVTISDRQKIVKNIMLVPTVFPTQSPIAEFTADQTHFEEDEEVIVHFSDLSTHCPDSWQWFFEGGTPETSTEQNPVVTYNSIIASKSISFDVKLVVRNALGVDTILKNDYITVTTLNGLPIASFEADKTEIDKGDYVQFTDLSQNATTWEWYFEGGTPETSTEQNPSIFYENKGVFDVKLTVTNDAGSDEMLKENYILVNAIAINEIEDLQVEIFPNPVPQKGIITVKSNFVLYRIDIINILGVGVKTEYPKLNSYGFSVSDLECGFYLMRIENEKGVFVTKIQVQ